MLRNLSKFLFALTLCAAATCADAGKVVYVTPEGGVYKVYDPASKKTVWVKDAKAYIKHKYQDEKIEGFGSRLSNKEFQKGATPVEDTVEAAADATNYAAGSAYNVANRVPSWRRYTLPLRALFGSNSQQQQQQP